MDRKRGIAIGLAAVAIWMLAGAIAPAASEKEVKTEILETDFVTEPAPWEEEDFNPLRDFPLTASTPETALPPIGSGIDKEEAHD